MLTALEDSTPLDWTSTDCMGSTGAWRGEGGRCSGKISTGDRWYLRYGYTMSGDEAPSSLPNVLTCQSPFYLVSHKIGYVTLHWTTGIIMYDGLCAWGY